MIYGYVGRPRSGKTLDATRRIVDNLKLGRVVCTDIEGMNDPKCQSVLKSMAGLDDFQFANQFVWLGPIFKKNKKTHKMECIRPSLVSGFWTQTVKVNVGTEFEDNVLLCPHNSFIVLDEVHKTFSNREFNSIKNKEFADWASTHGHDGYDVILITQDINKIEKHVRSLIETTYYYRKVNFLGGMFESKYIKYIYDGDDHEGKTMCPPSYHKYDSNLFACYKSMSNDQVKQIGIQKKPNILKQPIFFIIPVVFAVFFYMLFFKSSFATGDMFGAKKVAHKNDIKKPLPASAPMIAAVPAPVPATAPRSGLAPITGIGAALKGAPMAAPPLPDLVAVAGPPVAAPGAAAPGAAAPGAAAPAAVVLGSRRSPDVVAGCITYGGKSHVLLVSGEEFAVAKPSRIGSVFVRPLEASL